MSTQAKKTTRKSAPRKSGKSTPKKATPQEGSKRPPAEPTLSSGEIKKVVASLAFDHDGDPSGDGYRRGKTTGQLLTHYLNGLFWAASDEGWTDSDLSAILKVEFPDRPLQAIGAYRSYFNAGKHGFGWMDDDGNIVKPDEPLRRVGQ